VFIERYREDLEQELNSDKFKEAFEELKKKHIIFAHYPTIDSLRYLMNPGNKDYWHKDEVMTVLLRELHTSKVIFPLINILFWDGLQRLYHRYCASVADQEELFSRIQWDFYQSVVTHDLDRLPRKIDVNIFLNTKKRIVGWIRDNVRQRGGMEELSEYYRAGFALGDLFASKIYPEEMEAYLLEMVYRKVITETQYDLLLETLVYKRMNQREWAERKGLCYNTVRNLRYRAQVAMRGYEGEKIEGRE